MLPGVLNVTDEDRVSGLFRGFELMFGLSKQGKTGGSVIFWLSREQSEQSEEQFKGEALKVEADASGVLGRVFSVSQAASVSTRCLM